MKWTTIIVLTAGLTWTLTKPAAASQSPDLDTVLSHAIHYVADYEAQLGNLIGEEDYIQNAAWAGASGRYSGATSQKKQRRLESDFLILQVGKEWIGVRNVNKLDGFSVKRKVEDLQEIFDDSPAAVLKTLESIALESAKYNIGDVVRNTNLPTFALQVLRPHNLPRFRFEKAGEPKIGGVRTWAVNYQEIQSPSLIHDQDNHDEFAYGTLWIEPDTGRILKTELNLGGRGTGLLLRTHMVVSYEENKKLAMLIPSLMLEHYETDNGHTIDCRADYSRFHRFEVDVNFDIAPPPAPKPAPPQETLWQKIR